MATTPDGPKVRLKAAVEYDDISWTAFVYVEQEDGQDDEGATRWVRSRVMMRQDFLSSFDKALGFANGYIYALKLVPECDWIDARM